MSTHLTPRDTARLLDMKKRIDHLSLSDQLRFAAACLDNGEEAIAETLTGYVVNELYARRLLTPQGHT